MLSPLGAQLFPKALTGCLPQLAAGAFDGVAPADLFRPDADLTRLVARLTANDPDDLSFRTPGAHRAGRGRRRRAPGADRSARRGLRGPAPADDYKRYPGVDHFGLVKAAAADATAYLARRLR